MGKRRGVAQRLEGRGSLEEAAPWDAGLAGLVHVAAMSSPAQRRAGGPQGAMAMRKCAHGPWKISPQQHVNPQHTLTSGTHARTIPHHAMLTTMKRTPQHQAGAHRSDSERPRHVSVWLLPGRRNSRPWEKSAKVPGGTARRCQCAASVRMPASCREKYP